MIPFAVAAALAVGACGSSSSSSSATTAAPGTSATTATTAASGGSVTTAASSGGPQVGNPTSSVTLNESGSSLLYPFLQTLVSPLKSAYSNVALAPAAGGSGKGISDATSGVSQMGGSDAYLTPAELSAGTLLNVPIAVSAQDVYVNLPGVTNLKLSGQVLSDIYQGKVTKWNAPEISALNTGTTLPSTSIYPIHRSDSSGDTFLFTSFLSKTDTSGWGSSSGPQFGTTVKWPSVSNALTASGNPGMVSTCKATVGCVAYIGISAQSTATAAGLELASLKNQAGDYLTASATTINSAVAASTADVPANLAASLIYASGAMSYPIVNFEYIVVKKSQSSANTALAIRDFLTFAISTTGGSTPTLLASKNFQALPTSVVSKVNTAIASIAG
jgi:phosphate transport system substrate-binding protein